MLSDLMFRRLGLGWEPSMGLDVVHRVAMEAAPVMGWSDHETRAQVAAYESFVRDHFNLQEQLTRAEAGSAVHCGAEHGQSYDSSATSPFSTDLSIHPSHQLFQ